MRLLSAVGTIGQRSHEATKNRLVYAGEHVAIDDVVKRQTRETRRQAARLLHDSRHFVEIGRTLASIPVLHDGQAERRMLFRYAALKPRKRTIGKHERRRRYENVRSKRLERRCFIKGPRKTRLARNEARKSLVSTVFQEGLERICRVFPVP